MPSLPQFRRSPYASKPGRAGRSRVRWAGVLRTRRESPGRREILAGGARHPDPFRARALPGGAGVRDHGTGLRPGRAVRRRRHLQGLDRPHRLRGRLVPDARGLDRTAVRELPARRTGAVRSLGTDHARRGAADEPVPRRRPPPGRLVSGSFQSPPGTQDWLPERMAIRRAVVARAEEIFGAAGYREMAVPLIEDTSLFVRTSGEGSDVVTKEMYSFVDRGERDLSLRPELTAGLVRAYLQHGLATRPQPVRIYSCGTAYRYNRMQRGRLREFVQFDVEAIGSADPAVDAEIIALQMRWLEAIGMDGLELEINSIDTPVARRAYVADLQAFLDE